MTWTRNYLLILSTELMRIISLIVFLLSCGNVIGQNLFDESHTKSFANYLYSSGQYKLAAEEYERAVFQNSFNDSAKYLLVKSYRKAGLVDRGLIRLQQLYDTTFFSRRPLLKEWAYMHVLNNDFLTLEKTLENNSNVNSTDRTYILMNTSLLRKNWKAANIYYETGRSTDEVLFSPYAPVIDEALNVKHRSAALAMAFSAVVPGTGKVYAGQWKDGLIAAIMIGASAYQAYRGYDRDGFKSVKFWAFGSVATGFYLGNIYGSYKAARKYNQKHDNEIVDKARRLFMVGD